MIERRKEYFIETITEPDITQNYLNQKAAERWELAVVVATRLPGQLKAIFKRDFLPRGG